MRHGLHAEPASGRDITSRTAGRDPGSPRPTGGRRSGFCCCPSAASQTVVPEDGGRNMNIQQRASRMRKPDRDSGGPSPRSEMSRRVLRGRLISDTAHRLRIPRIVEPMSGRGTGVMSVPCPAHHRSHARPRLRAAQIATTPLRRSHGREYFFRVVEQLKIHLPPCRQIGRAHV